MSRSLIVLPDAGPAPIVALLDAATVSLRIKPYALDHPLLLAAVVAAAGRGVSVRVLFNRAGHGGVPDNAAARAALQAGGAEVADASKKLSVVHEKSLIVDDHTALVQSLDWSAAGFAEARDHAVATTHRHEVEEIAAGFDADWQHEHFKPHDPPHLIWSPLSARARVAGFIDAARHSLLLQSERFHDPVIIERLVRARQRGVKLRLMAHAVHRMQGKELVTDVSGLRLLADLGVPVHRLGTLRLHANLLLADGDRAIVGSVNLGTTSLDQRRELAIEVDEPAIVEALHATAHGDWKASNPIDLSDAGMLRELEQHGRAADAAQLELDAPDDE